MHHYNTIILALLVALLNPTCGCGPVAGNYPQVQGPASACTAIFEGSGFCLLAGSRLPVEKVRAELNSLHGQGYSRHDPQIIKSVARRNKVPPGLLADRSGSAYYRMQVRLKPGVGVTLDPGALKMTVSTDIGILELYDQGYILEDRRYPGGCRVPSGPSLALGSPDAPGGQSAEFLVRLPVRGEIVGLDLVPQRFQRSEPPAGD